MTMNFPFAIRNRPRQHYLLLVFILLAGLLCLALAYQLQAFVWRAWAMPQVRDATYGGLVAAGATALGVLPILFFRQLPERLTDTLYGFGAGVMLAASAFSLVIPGIAAAIAEGYSTVQAAMIIGLSITIGAALLLVIEHVLPHEHFIKGMERHAETRVRRTWLFVFAIILHNIPEGLAIGVGFAGGDVMRGGALATGIAIQDVPEGFVVAMALAVVGYSRAMAIMIGIASGLVEPAAAFLGAAVIAHSSVLLPWGLGFAAGAMLFVVSHEIIPESHRKGHEVFATSGLILGFVLMMILDTTLG